MGRRNSSLLSGIAVLICLVVGAGIGWSFFGLKLNLKGDPSVSVESTGGISTFSMSGTYTAAQYVQHGRDLLAARNFSGADQSFRDGVSADPANQDANFLSAVTRIVGIVQNQQDGPDPGAVDSLGEFMDAFGVSGSRSIYDFTADIQKDINGKAIVQPNLPHPSEFTAYLANQVVPDIDAAVAGLDATGHDYTIALMPSETSAPDGILVDHGDIAMFKSALLLTKAASLFSAAYNTDVDPNTLYDIKTVNGFLGTQDDILNPNPNLLTPVNPALLPLAKAALKGSIAAYLDGSDYIRNDRPADRRGNLVVLDQEMAQDEADFRLTLQDVSAALDGPGYIRHSSMNDGVQDMHADLAKAFDGANPIDIRSKLPQFDPATNNPVPGTVPDETFGGILDGMRLQVLGGHEGFVIPVGAMADLQAQLHDYAGNPVTGAAVTLTFNNGDSPVLLYDDGLHNDFSADDGIYGGLWMPANAGTCTVTGTASHAGYPDAHAWVSGDVVASMTGGYSIDTCGQAAVVGTLPFVDLTDLSTATTDYGINVGDCFGIGMPMNGVWYTYTPTVSGPVRISASPAETRCFSPMLYVYSGDCGTLTDMGCMGSDQDGRRSLILDAQAGTTYYVLAGAGYVNPFSFCGSGLAVRFEDASGNFPAPPPAGPFDIQAASVDNAGNMGNAYSLMPSLSNDGRFIAFESIADNLVPGDSNGSEDIFVRDTLLGTTSLVSVSGSGEQGNSGSSEPAISDDGRYVAFSSSSPNLVPGDTNYYDDVFVRDTLNNTTVRVSVASDGTESNGYSRSPSLSADGRYVLFVTEASNLDPATTGYLDKLFVHDMQTGQTRFAGAMPDGGYIPASIDPTGQYVIFYYYDYSTHKNVGFRTDLATYTTVQLNDTSDFLNDPAHSWVSDDGRYMVYPENDYQYYNYFIKDLFTGEKVLVATSDYTSYSGGVLSGSGNMFAFSSPDGSLVPNDTNYNSDIFYMANPLYGQTFQLKTNAVPGSGGWVVADPAAVGGAYPSGSNVTVYAVPAPDYVFTGWSGDAAGTTNPLAVVMDGPRALTANFTYTGTDTTAPRSSVTKPAGGDMVSARDKSFVVNGTADDWAGSGVAFVDVSFDGGTHWSRAKDTSGKGTWSTWSMDAQPPASDGWYAIQSRATDMLGNVETPGPGADFKAVYGSIYLASVNPQGTGVYYSYNEQPTISHDGRFIAYQGYGSNPAYVTGYKGMVFVRDSLLGTTDCVSTGPSGVPANNTSYGPALNGDGSVVVFDSLASNLVTGDTNSRRDVFLRDRNTDTTYMVSVAPDGSPGNADSYSQTVSADGNTVVFMSYASNLTGEVYGNANINLFVRDMTTGVTSLVNVDSAGNQLMNFSLSNFLLSPDGSYAVFYGYDLGSWQEVAYTRNLVTGVTGQISMDEYLSDPVQPNISDDGRYRVESRYAADGNAIVIRDIQTGAESPGFIADINAPIISGDGSRICFSSWDSSLPSPGVNGYNGVYYMANPLLAQSTGSISGNVLYAGSQTGDLHVGVFTDPTFTGGPDFERQFPWPYQYPYIVDGLPDGTYYAGAVIQTGPDRIGMTDPYGVYSLPGDPGVPAPVGISGGQGMDGIDIALVDGTAEVPNPFWNPADAYSVHYNPNGYLALDGIYVGLAFSDPLLKALSVSVTGPGITGSLDLASDPAAGAWTSSASPMGDVFLGQLDWPALPLGYTFTAMYADGPKTYSDSVECYNTDTVYNITPSLGNLVGGHFTFRWNGRYYSTPNVPDVYAIMIDDANGNRVWEKHGIPDTSYCSGECQNPNTAIYDGPPLVEGATYYYWVGYDGDCRSFTRESFVYTVAAFNDECADAEVIASLPAHITANTTGANANPATDVVTCTGSVGSSTWYTFTAQADGILDVDTFGSDYDTVLMVYGGASCGSLTPLGCNDDDSGLQSRLQVNVVQGMTCYIMIGTYGGYGNGGTLNLNLSWDPSHCGNGIMDADETGLDCGGLDCVTCGVPVACFGSSPLPAACNQTVNFDAGCSYQTSASHSIVTYEWDFESDGTIDAVGPTASHAYTAFGDYDVTLTVTDDNDPAQTGSLTNVVSVSLGNQAPVANPGGTYTVIAGDGVTLDGSGSTDPDAACGDSIVSYEWDINNDGTYDYTGASPAVPWTALSALPQPDIANPVTLRVTDSLGLSSTSAATLTIRNLYALTLGSTAGGTATTDAPGPYMSGSTVTLTAVPDGKCYAFTGWSGDASGKTNPLTVTMDRAKSVTATYVEKTYMLSTSVNDPAMGAVSPGGVFPCMTPMQVTATPNPGYVFTGWSGSYNNTNNPLDFVMGSDKSVTANFAQGNLAFGVALNGRNVALTATLTYQGGPAAGKTIVFFEKMSDGAFVSRWTAVTDVNGIAVKTFTSTLADHTMYVKFRGDADILAIDSAETSYTVGRVDLVSPPSGALVDSATPTLYWMPHTGATLYHVQVSTTSGFIDGTVQEQTTDLTSAISPALVPGTTYYWRVTAEITEGTNVPSIPGRMLYKVPTAVGLTYTQTGDKVRLTATLTDGSGNPLAGKALRFYDGGVLKASGTADANGQLVRIVTSTAGTHGFTAAFGGDAAYLPSTSPIVPVDLGVVALAGPASGATVSNPTPLLAWAAYTGATKYYAQVSTTSAFTAGTVRVVSSTGGSVNSPSLTPGVLYYWRVYAKIPSGTSIVSAYRTLTYRAAAALGLAYAQDGTGVTLTASLSDMQGGPLSGRTVGIYEGATLKATGTTNAAGRFIGTVTAALGTHDYVARFTGDTAYTATDSAPASVYIGRVDPSTPADGATLATVNPLLSWNAFPGALLYHVLVSTSPDFAVASTQEATTTGTSVTFPASLAGRPYYWLVYADMANGRSVGSVYRSMVCKYPTTLVITNTVVNGQTVTVTASLTRTDTGAGVPRRVIGFYESTGGGTPVMKGSGLSGTSAPTSTFSWNSAPGAHQASVRFIGDTQYAASEPAAANFNIP